jgi:hypothetical protein
LRSRLASAFHPRVQRFDLDAARRRVEGAFILARAYKESELIVRQSRHFREWLKLAFEGA